MNNIRDARWAKRADLPSSKLTTPAMREVLHDAYQRLTPYGRYGRKQSGAYKAVIQKCVDRGLIEVDAEGTARLTLKGVQARQTKRYNDG